MALIENNLNDLAFAVENEIACNERPIVYRALRDSAREFCIKSESLIGRSFYPNESQINTYDAAGSADAFVHRILTVAYLQNGYKYELDPDQYRLLDTNMVLLKQEKKDVDQIYICSVLIPNPGSDNLPEELVYRYRDGLIYGACMRIARQAEKPWFSPQMEMYYRGLFLSEVTRAIANTEVD